jgi:hypothetical protein
MGHTAEWGTFPPKQGVLAKSSRAGSALGLEAAFFSVRDWASARGHGVEAGIGDIGTWP